MEITSIQVFPRRLAAGEPTGPVATARVVINGMLALNGLRLVRGRYGYFLSFPESSKDSPRRVYESVSEKFRKALHHKVLREYEAALIRNIGS